MILCADCNIGMEKEEYKDKDGYAICQDCFEEIKTGKVIKSREIFN